MHSLLELPAAAVRDERIHTDDIAVRVASVGKTFARTDSTDLRVLDDINFSVRKGHVTAILGASGCGKSTLLNMIAGLLPADQGRIYLNGTPASDFTDWKRVAYLFQDDRLLPWRTAIENVEFGLEAERVTRSERRRRAEQTLHAVG